jgi:hypothetical protein
MAKKLTTAEKIRRYLVTHPGAKPKEIAQALGVSAAYVSVLKATDNKKKREQAVQAIQVTQRPIKNPAIQVEMIEPIADPVNHPAHYKYGGIETIDFIEAKELGYNLGNVVKYITRADHKGSRKQDLEKAMWYLKRELNTI